MVLHLHQHNIGYTADGMPREFELTAVQGHPRSSILVSIESSHATFY